MNFLEKDLETIIFETDNDLLRERGLCINGRKKRQVSIGNYGIADLITLTRPEIIIPHNCYDPDYVEITVFELKKDLIDYKTFNQALAYMHGIMRFINKRPLWTTNYKVTMCLIGKTIDTSSNFAYLSNAFVDKVFLYTYDYKIDGIHFTSHADYKLQNEGF